MIRIKRINESAEKIISVLDIEDYLQEVWDGYSNLISGWNIQLNYITPEGEFLMGDESLVDSIIEPNPINAANVNISNASGYKIAFDIFILYNQKVNEDSLGWGSYTSLNKMVDMLTQIKNCLKRVDCSEQLITLSNDKQTKAPQFEISLITNTIVP